MPKRYFEMALFRLAERDVVIKHRTDCPRELPKFHRLRMIKDN